MSFPETGQLPTEFFIDPKDLFAGDRYAVDFRNDVTPTVLIGAVEAVGQEDTVTVTWVADDQFGFIYDGVVIVATADTDDDTSAIALEVAANTALAGALAGQIASVSLVTNVLTVVSVAGTGAHTLADYEPDTTTVLIANTVVAAATSVVTFGMGVTQDTTFPEFIGAGTSAVRKPTGASDDLYGFMIRQAGSNYDDSQLALLGLPLGALAPSPVSYSAITKGSMTVPWVGALPTAKGNQTIHWINNASAAVSGACRSNDDGTTKPLVVSVDKIITRPQGSFTGYVQINIKAEL